MGKIKKILETELVGGTQSTDVYPVTSTKAVYDTNNKVLDDYIQHLKKTSTFAGIATPTTNPGTPDGPVFYIAGEGTYANFSNIVIEAGQLGILKWNGTWSKEVLEIGAGGGSGGNGSGSGVSLGTLLAQLNNENPFPTDNGQVLTYNGSNFIWKIPTGSGSGGSTTGGIRIKRNGSTLKDSNGNVLSCTSINFKYGENWNSTPILINSDNEISVDLSVVANNGNGSSSSSNYPLTIYNGSSNTDYITYDGSSAAYLKFKSGFSISKVGLGYEISVSGGGSGSSSRINKIKLFNSAGESFKTVSLGTADTIGFMAGNNVSLEAVVKEFTNVIKISANGGSGSSGTTTNRLYFRKDGSEESWNGENNFIINFGSGLNVTWDSHSQITLSATGGSGGSSGGSISWTDVTNKPSTFTPSSHTHSTNEITGLSNYVQGVKVNNASAADRLANAVTLWGNNFSGNNSIGTSSTPADLRYVKDIYAGNVFDIKAGNNSLLKVDGTPNIYVGFDYKNNANASILLFGNKTAIYTSGNDYHYDFKGNVFDVNSNQIHFGSETNGGKIYWDAANNAFKIEGNVYATGGITALGVSNSATTSNNVDFTFRNVTANTFNVKNSIQLSDNLSLTKHGNDVYLASDDGFSHSIYLDGMDQNYYLSSQGEAYFSYLNCDTLNFSGCTNFEIINAGSTTFTIQFEYNSKTYQFTPSEGSVTVS